MKGAETEKLLSRWSFTEISNYLSGNGLDIGFKGSNPNAEPITPDAIGVDLDYPGYDGHILPFKDNTKDFVFSSHCLEHIKYPHHALREYYRVTKDNGYIILYLPHQYLYERKTEKPSRWNEDHKWFFTPGKLLEMIESSLKPNTYELISCKDCRDGYIYSLPVDKHPGGEYSIECILRKIKPPVWDIE